MLDQNIFTSEIRDTFILNIPHASTYVPDKSGFVSEALLQQEIILLTDHATDEIFNIDEITTSMCDFSRVFCDVERFSDDDKEIMSKKGMGMLYTHTDNGELLRRVSQVYHEATYRDYYLDYHNKLEDLVHNKLLLHGVARIVDCHSFSPKPFKRDIDQKSVRPDVCLGTDPYHTPDYLLQSLHKFFENEGYSVAINTPYSGTFVPTGYYTINKKVESIMIEFNRNLYMDRDDVLPNNVKHLNELMEKYFNF